MIFPNVADPGTSLHAAAIEDLEKCRTRADVFHFDGFSEVRTLTLDSNNKLQPRRVRSQLYFDADFDLAGRAFPFSPTQYIDTSLIEKYTVKVMRSATPGELAVEELNRELAVSKLGECYHSYLDAGNFNRIFDMYHGETFCVHLHGIVLIFVSHRHFLVVQWSRDTLSKQRSLFRRGLIDDIRIADDDLFESTNFHEACTQGIYCLNS
jgi:hypothetical protein